MPNYNVHAVLLPQVQRDQQGLICAGQYRARGCHDSMRIQDCPGWCHDSIHTRLPLNTVSSDLRSALPNRAAWGAPLSVTSAATGSSLVHSFHSACQTSPTLGQHQLAVLTVTLINALRLSHCTPLRPACTMHATCMRHTCAMHACRVRDHAACAARRCRCHPACDMHAPCMHHRTAWRVSATPWCPQAE
jgi:hypothetical protein